MLIPLLYNARKKKVVEFFVKADIYFCFFFVSVKRRRFTITAGDLNIKKLPLRETVRMHTVPVKGAKFLLCGFKAEACGKAYFASFSLMTSAICSAERPNSFSRSIAGPEWPYTSLTPMRVTGVGQCSESAVETASPRPPMMLCSSTVMTRPVFFAEAITSSSSSGLMVWILMTSTLMPSSFSASQP